MVKLVLSRLASSALNAAIGVLAAVLVFYSGGTAGEAQIAGILTYGIIAVCDAIREANDAPR